MTIANLQLTLDEIDSVAKKYDYKRLKKLEHKLFDRWCVKHKQNNAFGHFLRVITMLVLVKETMIIEDNERALLAANGLTPLDFM